MNRLARNGLWLVFGLAALATMTWMWRETNRVTSRDREAVEAKLRDLDRTLHTMDFDVLRARFGLVQTYDPIVTGQRQATATLVALRSPLPLDSDDQAQVNAAIAAFEQAFARKIHRVETFKSRNSVLRNSERYAPTLAVTVEKIGGPVAPLVHRAMARLVAFEISSSPQDAAALLAAADQLDEVRRTLAGDDAVNAQLLAGHLRTVARAKLEVDELVRTALDPEVDRARDALTRAVGDALVRVEQRQAVFRAGLYVLSVALAALVVAAFVRLRVANATLEQRVAERTAALDARTTRMRLVLDHVKDGLAVVAPDGRLEPERSAAFDTLVAGATDADTLQDAVARINPSASAWLTLGWGDLFAEVLPFEVMADQLPHLVQARERTLALEYHAIRDPDGALRNVLLVASDATDRVERERSERQGRDLLAVLRILAEDRNSFYEWIEDTERLVAEVAEARLDPVVRMRALHTLKGNAALLGIAGLAELCHQLEQQIADTAGITAEHVQPLTDTWRQLQSQIAPFLGNEGAIELSPADHERLVRAVDVLDRGELKWLIERLRHEPIEQRFERLSAQAQALGARLGKPVRTVIDAPNVRLPRALKPFWSTFAHLVRNAIDHGIEVREVRVARGKEEVGTLTFSAREQPAAFAVELADNGDGIDWGRLADRAAAKGLPNATAEDLVAALFADGVSTRTEVSDVSGRGVGLAAVRNAVETLGGRVEVESERGRGTRFRFIFPRQAYEPAVDRPTLSDLQRALRERREA